MANWISELQLLCESLVVDRLFMTVRGVSAIWQWVKPLYSANPNAAVLPTAIAIPYSIIFVVKMTDTIINISFFKDVDPHEMKWMADWRLCLSTMGVDVRMEHSVGRK
jgi:hypothetical protein